MSFRLRALLAALPIVALMAVSGTAPAAAAKTKTKVEPASTFAYLNVHGTKGWKVEITAMARGSRRHAHPIAVYASGPDHQEVAYQGFRGRFEKDGSMVAKLPGVGRIDLRYEPTEHHVVRVGQEPNCVVAHTTIDSSGIFRGTIELHGEGGFTTVSAHSAHGELSTYPKQTCRVRARPRGSVEGKGAAGEPPRIEAVYASRKLGGGRLTFYASDFPSLLSRSQPRRIAFTAGYSHRRHGIAVSATTRVEGTAEEFGVSAPAGTVSEATVEPPAPFAGSADFVLASPTVATWTGDLRVPIATLGTVDLTGPKFRSAFCEGSDCTETAPGLHISFTAVSISS